MKSVLLLIRHRRPVHLHSPGGNPGSDLGRGRNLIDSDRQGLLRAGGPDSSHGGRDRRRYLDLPACNLAHGPHNRVPLADAGPDHRGAVGKSDYAPVHGDADGRRDH